MSEKPNDQCSMGHALVGSNVIERKYITQKGERVTLGCRICERERYKLANEKRKNDPKYKQSLAKAVRKWQHKNRAVLNEKKKARYHEKARKFAELEAEVIALRKELGK